MKKIFPPFLLLLGFLWSCHAAEVRIITLDDSTITPVIEEYISDTLKQCENEKNYLLIQINTPGGLLKPTQNIVQALLNSTTPTIAYIAPRGTRAASAGTFIGYACHILAMAPSTRLGAAHPILGGGSWGDFSPEIKTKLINDTLAWAKNIALMRNRPFSFLERSIQESVSLTEQEAEKEKIIDCVAENIDDLLQKIDGKEISLPEKKTMRLETKNSQQKHSNLNQRQKILTVFANPNIAYLFLVFGFLGLIFEITHPGTAFPGILGTIALVLSFYSFQILPVNYAGVILIVAGIVFFIIEAFTPAFGVLTLGGIIAFIFGSIMLFRNPSIFSVSLSLVVPIALALAFWSIFILGKALKERVKKPRSGQDALVGREGIAQTDIAPHGKVFIRGELWNASSTEKIRAGEKVIIEKTQALTLFVKKAQE